MSVTVMLSARERRRRPYTSETNSPEDITKDVPELSTLLRWKERWRAHQREEEQRKRRLDKGKGVLVVEAPTPTLAGTGTGTRGPCDVPTHQSPPGVDPVLERHDGLSGPGNPEEDRSQSQVSRSDAFPPISPGCSSSAVVTQPAEIQVPSSMRNTSQEPPSSAIEPKVPAQADEQDPQKTIPVTIPLSKLERVKQMEFRSSQELRVKEIRLSKPEHERLRIFSEFVGAKNQILLFGRHLPQCHRYAVQLERDGSKPETYICIEGLKKKEDIRDFYAVMSQRKYRKYYEPWKICFRMVDVSNCTAGVSSKQDLEWTAASCLIDLKSKATLCGSHVSVSTTQGDRLSTIGGVLQLGSELFALTTAHGSVWPDTSSGDSSRSTLLLSSLRDEDFADDLERILIMSEDTDMESLKPAEPRQWKSQKITPLDAHIYEHQKDDWCLIPVPPKYQLINYSWDPGILNPKSPPFKLITEAYVADPSGIQVCSYLGGRRKYPGAVGYAPSFLDGLHGPTEVWAVTMNHKDGGEATRGDSGLWFLTMDREEVVGSLVATCRGKVFITLLARQLESIARSLPPQYSPSLPRPDTILLRGAKHYSMIDWQASDRHIRLLFYVVQQPNFAHSALTLTLKRALEFWGDDDVSRLKEIIAILGPDLERTLQTKLKERSMFPSDQEMSATFHILALVYHSVDSKVNYASRRRGTSLPDTSSSPPGVHVVPPPTRSPPPIPPPTTPNNPDTRRGDLILDMALRRELNKYYFFLAQLLLVFACYLAGLGIGAWKLLTGDLSSQIKIGVGVALIVVNILAGLLMYSWFRRL